jgi:hypothetical protein
MTDNPEASLNWVAERAACSLAAIFGSLRSQIQQDVSERQALRPPSAPYGFRFQIPEVQSSPSFTVALDGNNLHRLVAFVLRDNKIEVIWDGVAKFEATPNNQ